MFSDSILKNWTKTALECYQRGCNCEGCKYKEKLETNSKCQMKYVVLELVRIHGKPKEITLQQVNDNEDNTIKN